MNPSEKIHDLVEVRLPEIADIGRVEESFHLTLKPYETPPYSLVIDLSFCRFIEVASLMYVIAIVTNRVRNELLTSIRLPHSKDVRDFLLVWRFYEAVEEATGKLITELVPEMDQVYLDEQPDLEKVKYALVAPDPQLERLLSDRFFSFLTLASTKDRSLMGRVLKETDRWEGVLIRSVLAKHLSGPEGYFASRIVLESMSNSMRHPNARIIQTVSVFISSEGKRTDGGGHLTIVYWDDGESMIDTLKKAIQQGKDIRSIEMSPLYEDYQYTLQEVDSKSRPERIIKSNFLPNMDTPDDLLFLATVFPGITRDVLGEDLIVHKSIEEDPILSRPGMGLPTLVNCAVDIYGGMVTFRTRDFFMNIKSIRGYHKLSKTVRKRVKIVRYSESAKRFLGNMVTIRLPLTER